MRWQALPPFVSPLTNLTAFDVRNGGIIIPQGNVPRPSFLETINTASFTAQSCSPVVSSLPCAPVEYANTLSLGPGLRQFYKKNFGRGSGLPTDRLEITTPWWAETSELRTS